MRIGHRMTVIIQHRDKIHLIAVGITESQIAVAIGPLLRKHRMGLQRVVLATKVHVDLDSLVVEVNAVKDIVDRAGHLFLDIVEGQGQSRHGQQRHYHDQRQQHAQETFAHSLHFLVLLPNYVSRLPHKGQKNENATRPAPFGFQGVVRAFI